MGPSLVELEDAMEEYDTPKSADEAGPQTAARLARTERYRMISLGVLVMLFTAGFGLYARWIFLSGFGRATEQASTFLKELSSRSLDSQVLVFGPIFALLTVVSVLLVRHGLPKFWESVRRSALVGLLLGGCLLGAGLLASNRLEGFTALEWLFFIPVVPPVLLGYQGVIVWRQRPRSLGEFKPGVSRPVYAALKNEGMIERFEIIHRQLQRVFGGEPIPADAGGDRREPGSTGYLPMATGGGAYEPAYFVTHFAVPALLLLLVGFGAISVAWGADDWGPKGWAGNEYVSRGLRWGVAGAFAYVFTEFGSRLFRNDLTASASTWAVITLIVGPALAVILAIAWKMRPGDSPWQTGAVLFFAGLAPRRVVSIVENAALQLLKTQNDVPVATRLTPLTSLRGISPEIALRLREENIEDVGSLAYADPVRLVQSLPYDLRQVVDWIDQAQLALTLPDQYDTLNERGVTGAIDLAWRWLRASVKETEAGAAIAPDDTPPPSFKALVNGVDADATVVYEAAAQLFHEEQICLLWVMYNSFSTTGGSVETRIYHLPASMAEGGPIPPDSSPPKGSSPRLKRPAAPSERAVGDSNS